jgi:hypothetical protein
MWSQHGSDFNILQKDNELEFLPAGIYTLHYAPFSPMYLKLKQKRFEFPYKLYGNDGFPERVIKKYRSTKSNLGVLLCGLKGTGKTVQAEQICNFSEMPVILVHSDFNMGKDLITFLSQVDQEVVVMIDEYEKIFGKSDSLLSIMDGALNARHRRLFILTANTAHISEAMIDRPSRIHYLKRFGNLSVPVITEVVDDMLINKEYYSDVVEYLQTVDIVTIDIVKTVVSEVNLFNEPPQRFKTLLNVSITDRARWDIFDDKGNQLLRYSSSYHNNPFMKGYELQFKDFGDNWTYFGDIKTCNQKTGKVVTDKGTYFVRKFATFGITPQTVANAITICDNTDDDVELDVEETEETDLNRPIFTLRTDEAKVA